MNKFEPISKTMSLGGRPAGSRREIKIIDTTLRDAHQSLWATRMRTDHMLSMLDNFDVGGFDQVDMMAPIQFDVSVSVSGGVNSGHGAEQNKATRRSYSATHERGKRSVVRWINPYHYEFIPWLKGERIKNKGGLNLLRRLYCKVSERGSVGAGAAAA